jgi:hypothetical protein
MFDKIAIIKTGWSPDYRGAKVSGNYSYKNPDHEKINFLPGPEGTYFCYVPPTGGNEKKGRDGVAPKPKNPDNWLVFAVSRDSDRQGIYVTGWYEDATFHHEYLLRPEYADQPSFYLGGDRGKITYTISAPRAFPIDGPDRDERIDGMHVNRHIVYLRGNDLSGTWRDTMAEQLLAYRASRLGLIENEDPVFNSAEDGMKFKYEGGRFGGGGESAFHRDLREWVLLNPTLVAPSYKGAEAATEFDLLSGDRVDNVFILPNRVAVIEVKSWISNDEDIQRGIYQCIKYRAVMFAMRHEHPVPVDAILVTERDVTEAHKQLLKLHHIRHLVAPDRQSRVVNPT